MVMAVPAEKIEVGDRIEVPNGDEVILARVDRVANTLNAFGYEVTGDNGESLVWGANRGETVNLVC